MTTFCFLRRHLRIQLALNDHSIIQPTFRNLRGTYRRHAVAPFASRWPEGNEECICDFLDTELND